MSMLVVVENDPDIQVLIEAIFSLDNRFSVAGTTAAAEDAVELAEHTDPEVIVLDDGLAGALTGIRAAPRLKQAAPRSKIILFTAHAELRQRAIQERAIDAFLLKTDSIQLLPLARRLLGRRLQPPERPGGHAAR